MTRLTGIEELEVIAETICRIDNETGPDVAVDGIPCKLHISVAVRVQAALIAAEASKDQVSTPVILFGEVEEPGSKYSNPYEEE